MRHIIAACAATLLVWTPAFAYAPFASYEKPEEAEPPSIDELITKYAAEYGASEHEMRVTIKCESNFNPKAVGDSGHSRGLVQIHRPSWPDITDEQAFNPDFAIRFMAERFSEGKERLWTCWRLNF